MAHAITAIIGNRQVLATLIGRFGFPEPTKLDFDLVIVPLNDQRLDAIATSLEEPFDGFNYLKPKLADEIGRALGEGCALYLETEYFGGAGQQRAAIFDNGALVWTSKEQNDFALKKSPISEGLAKLGVTPDYGQDEFDRIGLGRFRSFADFVSDDQNDEEGSAFGA